MKVKILVNKTEPATNNVVSLDRVDFDEQLPPFRPPVAPLNDKNWLLYAAKEYRNTQSYGIEEFKQDVKRFKYVRKAFTRYATTGELKERLVLNHIVVLNNVFGPEATVRLLFLKMPTLLHYLKPFLIALSILPDRVNAIGKDSIDYITDEIPLDPKIVEALRKI